ncbi:RabX1 [Blastocystis sp. ATCC 50177/Nand II]|uniref:RabX1 n=1 Tax=Blastocystis sp. subtype 1 (strain ATCC 50177 / NandII) TaxID=478820 RepID=A0A196S5J5_BLAHN|nr:RabX1 [Blastocystis sp. ATCC 50177/Nand II]
MNKDNSTTAEGEEIPCDVTMKVALIGDSAVGKTCLLNRYIQGTFSAEFYTTIGIDYRTKVESIDGKTCKLEVWDTAGQERFRAITKSYLRDVAGILLVFDITTRSSFVNISTWIKQIEDSGAEDVCCILIGTHGDVAEKRQVSDDEIKECAASLNYKYFITSAVDGTNVETAFQEMGRLILSKTKNEEPSMKSPAVNLDQMKEKNGCAC